MESTAERIKRAFSEKTNVIDILVEALQKAYEINLKLYDPKDAGHDEMTFGLMVAKSRAHFIAEAANKEKSIKIIKRTPYIYFQVGDYYVSSYRVGDSIQDDIKELFPNNRRRAWKLAKENQHHTGFLFPEMEFSLRCQQMIDDSGCRQIILADIGNSEEGFCKAFIGVPSKFNSDNGKITAWSTQVPIWERGEKKVANVPTNLASEVVPVEEVKAPVLKLKKKVEEKK